MVSSTTSYFFVSFAVTLFCVFHMGMTEYKCFNNDYETTETNMVKSYREATEKLEVKENYFTDVVEEVLNELRNSEQAVNICLEIAEKCFQKTDTRNLTVILGPIKNTEWQRNIGLFDKIMREVKVLQCEIKANIENDNNSGKLPEAEDVQNKSINFFFTMIDTSMFVFANINPNSNQLFLTAELCPV